MSSSSAVPAEFSFFLNLLEAFPEKTLLKIWLASLEIINFPFGYKTEVQHLGFVNFQELADLHRRVISYKWSWQCCQYFHLANNFPCKILLLLG